MRIQAERARAFRTLHERPGIFVMPNPWDAGTAKLFASLGFEALATTSFGLANALGRVDGTLVVSREELIANCRDIAQATDLPVNADLENGYADNPKEAAEIIRMAAEAGVVGGSIEDATGRDDEPIYDFNLAARAENFLHGRHDLDDTVKRLQAFAKAGADVLYAPGLRDLATIRQVVAAVTKPLNVVMSAADPDLTTQQLADAGVRRISIGGTLSRLAYAAVRDAAIAMRDKGSYQWVRQAMPSKDLKAILEK